MEPVLLDMALKGALVLILTVGVAAGARSASAAARHLVWSIGLAAVVALPLLQWLLPAWDLAILPARASRTVSAPVPATPGAPDLVGGLTWLWLAGTAATLTAYLVGRARVRWIARAATPVDHGPWAALLIRLSGEIGLTRRVRLLRARGSTMPMMWGVLRPTILLPREADGWSPALQRDVLLHELAHVQRHDGLTQMIARLACALHWFDPLAWLAARRMRFERERACDDLVIAEGSPCDYAEHLLALARWRSTGAPAAALGMAGSSPLGDRLKAVLEAGRARRPVPLRAALGQTAAAALLVFPLAALHPAPVSRPSEAADPGGVLLVPPSASAGLRPTAGSPREGSAGKTLRGPASGATEIPTKREKAWKRARRATAASLGALAASSAEPERRPRTPRAIPVVFGDQAPHVLPAAATAPPRLVARVRVETRTEIHTCSEPKRETGDEAPVHTSRTTFAAIPQPVMTP